MGLEGQLKSKTTRGTFLVAFLCLLFLTLPIVTPAKSSWHANRSIHYSGDEDAGVRVITGDVELYFNATNGGEITEYYDLKWDPLRQKNLANISVLQGPAQPYISLFVSAFQKLGTGIRYGTGGDVNATVTVMSNAPDYVIVQTTSRFLSPGRQVLKDTDSIPIYCNTTWVILDNASIYVERVFHVSTSLNMPPGGRWYPFYSTRTLGFNDTATYYMFNTTYAFTTTVSEETYSPLYDSFPIFPNDSNDVFGIAVPFANQSLGGDGAHNIIVVYRYDAQALNVSEWKSDSYNGQIYQTGYGLVHEFSNSTAMFAHSYRMFIKFTHQDIDEYCITDYAEYFQNTPAFPLFEVQISTNKKIYEVGDFITVHVSGASYYDLTGLTAKYIVADSGGGTIYAKYFDPFNASRTLRFSEFPLSEATIPDDVKPEYVFTFQVVSEMGVVTSQSSTRIYIRN